MFFYGIISYRGVYGIGYLIRFEYNFYIVFDVYNIYDLFEIIIKDIIL